MIEYEDSQNKAAILMEALPYVRRFRGSVFVVKYGGSFMDSPDPEVRSRVAQDLVFLNFVGIKVVVVHGGGKAVTKELENRGLEANFINGLRVTDAKTIEIVDLILNGSVNAEVAEFVSSYDCKTQCLPRQRNSLLSKARARRRSWFRRIHHQSRHSTYSGCARKWSHADHFLHRLG